MFILFPSNISAASAKSDNLPFLREKRLCVSESLRSELVYVLLSEFILHVKAKTMLALLSFHFSIVRAEKIIAHRPYASLDELLSKKVLSKKQLTNIESLVYL